MNKNIENQKYKTLSKNIILFVIGNFGTKVISLVLLPLYTAVLTTEEYGTVELLTTTASLLMPLLTAVIHDAVLRFAMDSNYKFKEVISIALKVDFVGGIVLLAGMFIFAQIGIVQISWGHLCFLFLNFLFQALNGSFGVYLKARNRVTALVTSGIINTIVVCSLNVFFLVIVKWGLRGYLIANIVGMGSATLYQFWAGQIYKDITFRTSNKTTKEMLSYSSSLIANAMSWWINSASDRFILTAFKGVEENGIYSVAYKIPTILTTVQSIFQNAWSIAAISEFDKEDADGFIGNMCSLYSMVSILGSSFIIIFNKPIARLFYAKDFYMAWKCVPFLLAGAAINGIAGFQGSLLVAIKDTKAISSSATVGACVNIVCNFIFIYFMGAQGAAIATMLGYTTTWIMRSGKIKCVMNMKYDYMSNFINCVLLVVQAAVAACTDGIFIQIGLLAVILWRERKLFKKVICIGIQKLTSKRLKI